MPTTTNKREDYRNRLTFLKPGAVAIDGSLVDQANAPNVEFAAAFQLWGAVEDISGRELLKAQAIAADVTTRVILPFPRHVEITHDMRVQYQYHDRVRVMEFVTPPIDLRGDKRELEILCREVKQPAVDLAQEAA